MQWARSYLSIQARGCLVFRAPFPTADQIPHQERAIFPKTVLYQNFRHPKKGKREDTKGSGKRLLAQFLKILQTTLSQYQIPWATASGLQAAYFPFPCEQYFFLVNNPLEPKHHPQINCLRIPEKLIKKQMPLSHL